MPPTRRSGSTSNGSRDARGGCPARHLRRRRRRCRALPPRRRGLVRRSDGTPVGRVQALVAVVRVGDQPDRGARAQREHTAHGRDALERPRGARDARRAGVDELEGGRRARRGQPGVRVPAAARLEPCELSGWSWLFAVFGALLTLGAISLGAPFWFDALSRLARIRQTGTPPVVAGATRTGEGDQTRTRRPDG